MRVVHLSALHWGCRLRSWHGHP